jgi:hypothetical protein
MTTVIGYWEIIVGRDGKESYEGDTLENRDRITERLKKEGKVFSVK